MVNLLEEEVFQKKKCFFSCFNLLFWIWIEKKWELQKSLTGACNNNVVLLFEYTYYISLKNKKHKVI